MNFKDLQNGTAHFKPLLYLEDVFPRRQRRFIARCLSIFLGVVSLWVLAGYLFGFSFRIYTFFPQKYQLFLTYVTDSLEYGFGLLLVFLSVRITLILLEAFYNSYYFKGVDRIFEKKILQNEKSCVSYEVARIVHYTDPQDITRGFVRSHAGRIILERAQIGAHDYDMFLQAPHGALTEEHFVVESKECVHLSHYAHALYTNDKTFSHFLNEHNIQENDFLGAAEWVEETHRRMRKNEQWWSRDSLGHIPGIGKDWAYGNVYLLQTYGKEITNHPAYQTLDPHVLYGRVEVERLEGILARARDANILLVGEEGALKLQIIARLATKIKDGRVPPAIEDKRIFILDHVALIASQEKKTRFEQELLKIFAQAIKAGNIILVIENLPAFMKDAHVLGVDLSALLAPILSSTSLQIIATAGLKDFHETMEHNDAFMKYFERIIVDVPGAEIILQLLKDTALGFEHRKGVFFTFPALKAIAEGSVRYFGESLAPERAVDLLLECASKALQSGESHITEKQVLSILMGKTGMPMGEISEEEREKFIHLEMILHKRIVGQNEAIEAVSGALRRARSGVGNASRPVGSFLFLGPTGVGKTETAKALAEVFFGSESELHRFDMSEYAEGDALSRLIGAYKEEKAGTLASLLREKPYGVLLLDEFEKTNEKVHDLFLQILDEGEFKDSEGEKVNARNSIIIATSNAMSNLIWDYLKKGENVSSHKEELLDAIIRTGIFKAELVNRFDGIIVFHPLEVNHLLEIAKRMLEGLKVRLEEQGIELVINDALLNRLMEKGYDPLFGARPMRRALQDTVEQIIADKKIKGEITSGSCVELTEKDFLDRFD